MEVGGVSGILATANEVLWIEVRPCHLWSFININASIKKISPFHYVAIIIFQLVTSSFHINVFMAVGKRTPKINGVWYQWMLCCWEWGRYKSEDTDRQADVLLLRSSLQKYQPKFILLRFPTIISGNMTRVTPSWEFSLPVLGSVSGCPGLYVTAVFVSELKL